MGYSSLSLNFWKKESGGTRVCIDYCRLFQLNQYSNKWLKNFRKYFFFRKKCMYRFVIVYKLSFFCLKLSFVWKKFLFAFYFQNRKKSCLTHRNCDLFRMTYFEFREKKFVHLVKCEMWNESQCLAINFDRIVQIQIIHMTRSITWWNLWNWISQTGVGSNSLAQLLLHQFPRAAATVGVAMTTFRISFNWKW